MTLEAKIEAVLFYKSEPIAIKKLATILGTNVEEVATALSNLEHTLVGRGIALMRKDDEVKLATTAEASELITALTREELSRDLSKAGLETLSIILYRGPISRSQIDYIRGVNSTFIIRNLLIRGLIEKVLNEKDARSFLYRPTFELLSHLGVTSVGELPEYQAQSQAVEQFIAQSENQDTNTEQTEPTTDSMKE